MSEVALIPSHARRAGATVLDRTSLAGEMLRLYDLAARVARAQLNVLITGETGTGKEVLARTIHGLSPRSNGPFLAINCAGLPPSLIESELFGHERGAFTGAISARIGLFEAAQSGTVLLDEVGELPTDLQAKLLRVLEERMVLPIGAVRSRPIDVRILAATHRDLEDAVRGGEFRDDLYYRVAGITLAMPPLRQRLKEIAFLARQLVHEMDSRRCPIAISQGAIHLLQDHPWPGNVRQLRNVLERALLFCDTPELTTESVARALGMEGASGVLVDEPLHGRTERARIEEALDRCAGNQTRAARLLGVSRRTLLNKLRIYNFPRPRLGPTLVATDNGSSKGEGESFDAAAGRRASVIPLWRNPS